LKLTLDGREAERVANAGAWSVGGVSDLRADGADLIVFACPASDGFGFFTVSLCCSVWSGNA